MRIIVPFLRPSRPSRQTRSRELDGLIEAAARRIEARGLQPYSIILDPADHELHLWRLSGDHHVRLWQMMFFRAGETSAVIGRKRLGKYEVIPREESEPIHPRDLA